MKAAALAALLFCTVAHANDDPAAAFRDAQGDIDALERLGAARPVTPWTDDAWLEASRLAERNNDLSRAKRDLEQAIAIGSDPVLVQRAQGDLARITGLVDWTAVTAKHERLLPTINNAGDPRDALAKLEKLAVDHPRYPRIAMLMVQIATAWEREGDSDRALDWIKKAERAATTRTDHLRISIDVVRMLIRAGQYDEVEARLAKLDASRGQVATLRESLADARVRRNVRWVMWAVLVVLTALAAWTLRGRHRRLLRPPTEVLYMLPIGLVLALVAATGNPLVAAAIRWILAAGIAIAWISGSIEAKRRWLVVALAIVAVAAATYIAIDRGPLVDLLRETWREL